MITVREVKTAKEQKDFLNFPIELYKGNPYFVAPLYMDEKKIFRDDYVYNDVCDAVYFNAYDENGKIVGRISGINQKAANEKYHQKRVRFTRFDTIDSQEVADALFGAVENWARSLGMNEVCGPLGFSDLEKEGLLVEGFDQLSTFEEQYNAAYYEKLMLNCGFEKEVEWVESKLQAPAQEEIDKMVAFSEAIMKRYHLHLAEAKNVNDFLAKYADGFFELLDKSYENIYGTVPFTDGMKKMMIDNFKLIIDLRFVAVILDEQENVVCFGICFPSLAKTMQVSGGHLSPGAIIKFLKTRKSPEIIDLGLVGVEPSYLNKGIPVVVIAALMKMLSDPHVQYAETNLNLVDNYAIRNMWKRFVQEEHKRRRAYVKKIDD